MTTPEVIKEAPRPLEPVQVVPEQVDVHQTLVEQGVTPRPSQPQSLVQDGQVVAQSTGAPVATPPAVTHTLTVPMDVASATTLSQGDPANASTWLGATILRKIKKAFFYGWQVVVGGKS